MSDNTLGGDDALGQIDQFTAADFAELIPPVESAIPSVLDVPVPPNETAVAPPLPPTPPAPPQDDAVIPPPVENVEPSASDDLPELPVAPAGSPDSAPPIAPTLPPADVAFPAENLGVDVAPEPLGVAGVDTVAPISTEAEEAAPYWFHQSYKSSCLPSSVAGILSLYSEENLTDEDLLALLTPQERFDITYDAGLPVSVAERLLEDYNIQATVETSTIEDLDRFLDDGYGAIVAVDGGEIWYRDAADPRHETVEDDRMDHVMMVTDIDLEGGWVYVNDSGSVDGRALAIPLELFLDSWKDSDNLIVRIDTSLDEWRETQVESASPAVPTTPAAPTGPSSQGVTTPVNYEEASPERGELPPQPAETTDATPEVVSEVPSVLSELVKHPWIMIPGVITLGGGVAAAAVAATRKRDA